MEAVQHLYADKTAGHGASPDSGPPGADHWDYIVVGAGPGGLQMGHHLQEAGRSYVIMELGSTAGMSDQIPK